MTETRKPQSLSTSTDRPSSLNSPPLSTFRRQSNLSLGVASTGSKSSLSLYSSHTGSSPRVQVVPHIHRLSQDSNLSQSERDVLEGTSFDAFDVSSKDFDFEDIFTYDKPQKKLASVVEVSSASREKDWSSFPFSHFSPATAIRQKVNRTRNGKGELYVRNKTDARKR